MTIKAGKFNFSGGETLKIESGSVDEDLDSTFDAITGRIPPQFSGLVRMIGRGPFKDLFGVVNVFKIG